MQITVTGATGHLGGLVIGHLLSRGVEPSDIVATGRNTERLSALAERGVRTVAAAYEDDDALAAAVTGSGTVVLVSGSEVGRRVPQHRAVIDAATRSGVEHVVYTSLTRADTSPLFLAPEHRETELLLQAAPFASTILRNNWYNENYEQTFAQAVQTGVYLTSAGTGRVASASRSDYAEAAAIVAASGSHHGATLELAGDTAWNGDAFAAVATVVAGTPVEHRSVDSAQHRAFLLEAGLDPQLVDMLVTVDADIAAGALDEPSEVLSTLIGHPTTTLESTLQTAGADR